jgi:hypothetical protein
LFGLEEEGTGFLAFFSQETDALIDLEKKILFFSEETTTLFGLEEEGIGFLVYFCREPRPLLGLKVGGLAFLTSL